MRENGRDGVAFASHLACVITVVHIFILWFDYLNDFLEKRNDLNNTKFVWSRQKVKHSVIMHDQLQSFKLVITYS